MKFFDLEMSGLAGGLSKRNPMKAIQFTSPNYNGACRAVHWYGGTDPKSCGINPFRNEAECGTTTIYYPELYN